MSLNQPLPTPNKRSEYAAWGIVLFVMVHLCLLQVRPGSEARQILSDVTKGQAGGSLARRCAECDSIASKSSIDGRNVFLRFADHTVANLQGDYFVSFLYYRTTYALYPRRAYVAPSDHIVNGSEDLLNVVFDPNRQWLQERNIGSVLSFENNNSSTGESGLKVNLEVLNVRDAQAATQTNMSGGN